MVASYVGRKGNLRNHVVFVASIRCQQNNCWSCSIQLSPNIFRRNCNKAMAKVTGVRIKLWLSNRGSNEPWSQEIPCTYCLYGPSSYTDRVERILQERNIHAVRS